MKKSEIKRIMTNFINKEFEIRRKLSDKIEKIISTVSLDENDEYPKPKFVFFDRPKIK